MKTKEFTLYSRLADDRYNFIFIIFILNIRQLDFTWCARPAAHAGIELEYHV